MTPTLEEIKQLSIADKVALLEMLSQTLREDLIKTEKLPATRFVIESSSLEPYKNLDFDNIGKLLEETEGDFYK